MDLGAQLLEPLLLLDTKVLLLVDDHEAEIVEFYALAKDRVGADDNVGLTRSGAKLRRPEFGGRHHARDLHGLNRHLREARGEVLIMLSREQGCRYDDRDLLAICCGHQCGAQSNLRLAKADVTADQAIHWTPGGEVVEHRIDCRLLILCFLVRKARAELGIEAVGRHELWRRSRLAGSGDFNEIARHLKNALPRAGLALLPADAALFVELNLALARS